MIAAGPPHRLGTHRLGTALGITRDSAVFALRTAFTAWLAFAVATSLGIPNPYWAAMGVWVVAQPTRGILLERGVYRLIGTFAGAGAGFALLHAVHPPLAVLALLGAWVGLCAALVHILRYTRSYGAMMAGMTATVVVAPTLFAPGETYALAWARVECTVIGVVAATIVGGLFTPPSPRRQFLDQVRSLAGEAVAWAALCLDPARIPEADARQGELLSALAALEQATGTVAAGTVDGHRLIHRVHALFATILALMAAAHGAHARILRTAGTPEVDPRETAPETRLSTAGRADPRLGEALEELRQAERALLESPAGAGALPFRPKAGFAPHRDWPSARLAAAVAGLATFSAGVAALWLDWAHGSLTVLGVCIFAMILSSMDQPQNEAPGILKGVFAGVAVALVFRLLLLPHAASGAEVVAMIAPFMLAGGIARASRFTAKPALDANMCFLLASQPVLPVLTGTAEVLAGSAALVLSIVLVGAGYRLLPRDPGRRARGIAHAIVRDLERLTRPAPGRIDARWSHTMHHRVLRLMVHVGRAGNVGTEHTGGVLAALDLGHAIQRLHEALADPRRAGEEAEAPAQALAALRGFAADPAGTAARLDTLATGLAAAADAPVTAILRDAVDALNRGAGFFRFARSTPYSTG